MKLRLQQLKPNRAGWSLIEMTVVISLIGSFTLVGFSLLTRLMELDTTLAGATMLQLTTDRFEDQLRADARQIVKVEQFESGFDLTEQNGTVIEYRFHVEEDLVTRKIQEARRASKETFYFLNCDLLFQVTPQRLTFFIKKLEPVELKSLSSQFSPASNATIRMVIPIGRQVRFSKTVASAGGDS